MSQAKDSNNPISSCFQRFCCCLASNACGYNIIEAHHLG